MDLKARLQKIIEKQRQPIIKLTMKVDVDEEKLSITEQLQRKPRWKNIGPDIVDLAVVFKKTLKIQIEDVLEFKEQQVKGKWLFTVETRPESQKAIDKSNQIEVSGRIFHFEVFDPEEVRIIFSKFPAKFETAKMPILAEILKEKTRFEFMLKEDTTGGFRNGRVIAVFKKLPVDLKGLSRLHGIRLTWPKHLRRSKPANKTQKVCKFYNTEIGCRNGTECKFEHVQKQALPKVSQQPKTPEKPHYLELKKKVSLPRSPFIISVSKQVPKGKDPVPEGIGNRLRSKSRPELKT